MKGLIALFGCTLLILLMASTLAGIADFRSSSQTANYDVTTGVGVTASNITLALPVLDSGLDNFTSVTSNNTADAPIAFAFTASTKIVNITGLSANNARRLTLVYRTPKLDTYTGVDLSVKWWPLFLVFAIIAVVVAAIVNSFHER